MCMFRLTLALDITLFLWAQHSPQTDFAATTDIAAAGGAVSLLEDPAQATGEHVDISDLLVRDAEFRSFCEVL